METIVGSQAARSRPVIRQKMVGDSQTLENADGTRCKKQVPKSVKKIQ